MNIAQFVDIFYPSIDGVVKVVDNYSRIMNSYDNVNCSVFAPKLGKVSEDDFPYNVSLIKSVPFLGGYSCPLPALSPSIKKDFENQKIDIIHAHSPFTIGHYGYHLAKEYHIPFVMTFHSKYYEDFYNYTGGNKLIAKAMTDYIVRLYNKADKVLTVSQNAADTLKSYGYEGDVEIIGNASDLTFPENVTSIAKTVAQKYSIPADKKVLLFVGKLSKQKNFPMAIDTMKYLDESFVFVVAGNGNISAIKKYAENIGVNHKIILTGEIKDSDEMAALYTLSDLLFFPSTYDTFAIVVREAAQGGIPSLLINGSAAAEDIIDEKNGYVCDLNAKSAADKIQQIFSNSEKRQLTGQNAKISLSASWDQIVPLVYKNYLEVIANHKG